MIYKVGDLVSYNYEYSEEFLGIAIKAWKDTYGNMYLVYFFHDKTTYRCYENALCHVSIE